MGFPVCTEGKAGVDDAGVRADSIILSVYVPDYRGVILMQTYEGLCIEPSRKRN